MKRGLIVKKNWPQKGCGAVAGARNPCTQNTRIETQLTTSELAWPLGTCMDLFGIHWGYNGSCAFFSGSVNGRWIFSLS